MPATPFDTKNACTPWDSVCSPMRFAVTLLVHAVLSRATDSAPGTAALSSQARLAASCFGAFCMDEQGLVYKRCQPH